jgi:hypothetical protein
MKLESLELNGGGVSEARAAEIFKAAKEQAEAFIANEYRGPGEDKTLVPPRPEFQTDQERKLFETMYGHAMESLRNAHA